MNILFLTDKIDYVSGVAKHLFYLTDSLLKGKKDKIFMICSGGEMKEEFIKSGVNVYEYPRMSFETRSGMNFIYSILHIMRFCMANKITIIHSHTHYTANLGYIAAKILMIRSVQTVHGLIPEEGKLPHFRADLYAAVNKEIIKYMVKSKVKEEKIYLIPQGVPLLNSEPVKRPRPLKVLCASRLVYDKGVDVFINSAASISKQLNEETEFIVAGEGEYEKDLRQLAVEKGVNIKFTGKLENLKDILATSHIFVFPSRIKTEGFPVVLIEAGMNDNLIISSNFESLSEVLETSKDCIIFYNNDYIELAEKLLSAINNYDNLKIIADNWKRKCIEKFTSDIMAERTREVYKHAIQ